VVGDSVLKNVDIDGDIEQSGGSQAVLKNVQATSLTFRGSGTSVIGTTNTNNPALDTDDLEIRSNGNVIVKLDYDDDDDPANPRFIVQNNVGDDKLSVSETGVLKINDVYTFPTSDGTAGQVLTTDGSGAVTFQPASQLALGTTSTTALAGNSAINDLSDVNVDYSTPSASGHPGNLLSWDPTNSKWRFFSDVGTSQGNPVSGFTNVEFANSSLNPISLSNIGFNGGTNALSINTNVSPTGTNLFVDGAVRFNGAIQVGSGSAVTYALPTADGSANEVLTTDGSGLVTFQPTLQIGTTSTTALAGDTITISGSQASAITANTAKISYTDAAAVAANTAKVSYTDDAVDSRIGAASIDALSDVDTTTAAPTTGQALVWDGSQWGPGTVSGGGSSPWTTTGNDLYYNTGNVGIGTATPTEKLHVAGKANITDASNNVLISTGNSTITASNTVAVGYQALTALTTGAGNTAVGYQAGDSVTGSSYNTVVGYQAGQSQSTHSTSVTALGYQAGYTTTQGGIFIGKQAGYSVTNSGNIFVGDLAGQNVTSGASNVGIGAAALRATGTGTGSVALGSNAGRYATAGGNTLLGHQSGNGVSGSTFSNTVAVGYQALTALTTGNGNTAVGYQAGLAQTTAGNNTLLGYQAGLAATTGGNTLIGYQAGYTHTGHMNQTMIGSGARNLAGSGNDGLAVGSGANISGSNQAAVGSGAATGNGGTALGSGSKAGTYAVAIGQGTGSYSKLNHYSTHVGRNSGNNGQYSVALGGEALASSETNGLYNVALGYSSGSSITSGSSNVLIGYQAGSALTTESNKLYIENSNSATPLIYGEFDNDLVKVNGSFESTTNIFTKTANTDHSAQGDIVKFGTATTTIQGDLYYFNASGGWTQASADAAASSGGVLLAIALGTASATNGMLLRGIYTMDSAAIDGTEVTGDELYVGVTAGHITNTAPGSGDIVRIVGYCLDGTNGQIWFNPSNDFILVA
jgi:hypothetical protein